MALLAMESSLRVTESQRHEAGVPAGREMPRPAVRRSGQKLLFERLRQPVAELVLAPPPIDSQEPVDLGGRQGVDDVGGAALRDRRSERTESRQSSGNPSLSVLALPDVFGEQIGRLGIG